LTFLLGSGVAYNSLPKDGNTNLLTVRILIIDTPETQFLQAIISHFIALPDNLTLISMLYIACKKFVICKSHLKFFYKGNLLAVLGSDAD
jgi:hypothetical protein